jgi:DNA-directed RNA polymerase subunit RPC12/RpoP
MDKNYFCPRCHRPVKVPDFIFKAKITGKIKIKCGNCKKGEITING